MISCNWTVHLVGSGQSGFSLTDPLDCHVYLLDGGSELALIDTGVGRDTPAIAAEIKAAGFDPPDIAAPRYSSRTCTLIMPVAPRSCSNYVAPK